MPDTIRADALRDVVLASHHLAVRAAKHAGLSDTEHAALQRLAQHPRGLRPSQIAAYLGLTTGSVTKLIDRLENGDLARRRHPRTGDRRHVIILPTDHALTLADTTLTEAFTLAGSPSAPDADNTTHETLTSALAEPTAATV